jgi:hypothetical protein
MTPRDHMRLIDLIDDLDASYDIVIAIVDEHGSGPGNEVITVLDAIESATSYLYNMRYTNGENP